MGLYDYIRCKMPLPESPQPPKEEWMQTKDTAEQYLGKYTIEEDGRLIYHEIPRERVEDASSLLGFYMCPIAGAERDIEIPFHGDIGFGAYDSKTGEDWNYVARFTEGRCVRVWLDEYTPPKAPVPNEPKGDA